MGANKSAGVERSKQTSAASAPSGMIARRLGPDAYGIGSLCPDPCPQVLANSAVPCPAVAAMSNSHDLTPRERQALWLTCLGLKNGTIALRMGVAVATARLHLRNLHRKTGTADKVDLVLEAWRFCVKQRRTPSPRKRATYRKR